MAVLKSGPKSKIDLLIKITFTTLNINDTVIIAEANILLF